MLYDMNELAPERCAFNYGVTCFEHLGCERCGWNPTVSEKRREKARKKYEAVQHKPDNEKEG